MCDRRRREPATRPGESGALVAAGLAADVALAAAAAGAPVQIVGRVGEDAAGEAALLDLARRGVGHVAVLRDAARATPVDQPAPGPDDADDVDDADAAPSAPRPTTRPSTRPTWSSRSATCPTTG